MSEHKRLIWLIDESKKELDTYGPLIEKALGEEIEVARVQARATKQEYLDILQDPRTAAIIVDQRMKQAGMTDYDGIDLALFLRSIDSKMPIYILTNYADVEQDFIGGEWSVDEIIAKEDIVDADKRQTVASRLLRRIDTHRDLLLGRQLRFRQLLQKSLEGDLTDDEMRELKDLRLARTAPTLARELEQLTQLDRMLERHQELRRHLRKKKDELK